MEQYSGLIEGVLGKMELALNEVRSDKYSFSENKDSAPVHCCHTGTHSD
jgi:hypothetical protein